MVLAPVVTNFVLNEIYVYNSKNKGQIVPATANLESLSKVKAATVPSGAINNGNPLIYPVMSTMNKSFEREIYLFEALAVAQNQSSQATCIVVGGTYGTDATPTYYRLDFFKRDDQDQITKDYKDILRNHQYQVKITGVGGRGYDTPNDAFKSKSINMIVEVIDWDDSEIGHVTFNGQYYLGIEPAEFNLYRNEKADNKFIAKTDFPDGWEFDGITDSPQNGGIAITWIKNLSGTFSGVENKDAVTFAVEENTTGVTRTGYIHLKAGPLTCAVKVIQSNIPDLSIRITDLSGTEDIQELVFASKANVTPLPQQPFQVSWYPHSAVVSVTNVQVGANGFPPFGDSGAPMHGSTFSAATGTNTYTILPSLITTAEITPPAGNPFLEKISKVDFTVTEGGRYASKSIFLRQYAYNTVFTAKDYYVLHNAITHSFSIRSNTQWKITNVSDPDAILEPTHTPALLNQAGGYNTSATGQTVNFKFVTDTNGSKDGKIVTLTLSDPAGHMDDVYIILKGGTCGVNGNGFMRTIGNKQYLTHVYGDKCWMVQNLQEGSKAANTAAADYFGHGVSWINGINPGPGYGGCYYVVTQPVCPEGWRMPTALESDNLVNTINANRNAPHSKWWAGTAGLTNDAYTGYFNHYLYCFMGWRETGVWISGYGNVFYIISTGLGSDMASRQYTGAADYYSMRCVRE